MKNYLRAPVLLSAIAVSTLLISCSGEKEKPERGKPNSAMSTNIESLRSLGAAGFAQPEKVSFKVTRYEFEEMGASSPLDFEVDAIMYFDSMYFSTLISKLDDPALRLRESPKANRPKKDMFMFTWLGQDVKDELKADTAGWSGDAQHVLGPNANGKIWMLDRKILLRHEYRQAMPE